MEIKGKMIGSKYNYCFQYEENYLVYNTLNVTIFKVDRDTFKLLQSREVIETVSKYDDLPIQKLAQERLIVSVDEDEEKTAYHIMNRVIYENKLDVTIIPTQACNFRCVYCFEDHANNHMTDESEKNITKFFERNIRNYKSAFISWFGGEPLLQKERVLRIMRTIKKSSERYGVPVISDMVTNGYLLDIDTFNSLAECGILYYQITVDCSAETHNKLRPLVNGQGTYEQIIKNLVDIKNNSRSKRFKIIIRTNVDRNTAHEYKAFVHEINELLDNDRRFEFSCSQIADWGGDSVKELDLFDDNKDDAEMFNEYVNFESMQERKDSYAITEDISKHRCHAGKYYGFVILHDASVSRCATISYNASDHILKDANNCGYINNRGQLIFDETKNARYLSLPKPLDECDHCCWFPICMLSTCPNYTIKCGTARCFKKSQTVNNNKHQDETLISQYKKGVFKDLSSFNKNEGVHI